MSVIVNDLAIEPTTETPKPKASSASAAPGKGGPDLAREIERVQCRQLERALRVWAH